jgi:hypothetical protein
VRLSRFTGPRCVWPAEADWTIDQLTAALTALPTRTAGELLDVEHHPAGRVVEAKGDLPLWSPTIFQGPRNNVNARELSALVLDYDDGTTPEQALAPWSGCVAILHSSWSHTDALPKFRLVLPFSRPTPAATWSRVWWWAVQRAAGSPDPRCRDPQRAYFVPAARPGAWAYAIPGAPLEVPDPDTLDPPPSSRPVALGWVPCVEALRPEVRAAGLEAWRARVTTAQEQIGSLRDGRRSALQRWTYLLAGHAWLDPGLPAELAAAMWAAAVKCQRDNENTRQLVEDTIRAGQDDPIPVGDLVPGATGIAPPLVIKYRSGHWVRYDDPDALPDATTGHRYDGLGRYLGPYDSAGLTPALRDRGDVAHYDMRKDGPAPWSRDKILLGYGSNAHAVHLVYPDRHGAIARPWDPETRTLRTTRAVRLPVRAVYHADVAEWLDGLLLDTPLAGSVLDWLATVDVLERPSAALYLHGKRGVGKGLLAQALAAPWGTPAVPLDVVIGDYPIPIASCPIVWLDEGTSLDARGTARFRTTVSERQHTLNEKYLPHVPLIGCLRVVIGANNGEALGITELRSLDDLDAIADRILYVEAGLSERSAEASWGALARASATGSLATWVHGPDGRPGRIPEHLAWLAETRRVVSGDRWVVPGVRTAWHDSLLWRVPLYAATLETVVAGLIRRPAPAWTLGPDGATLTASALHGQWDALCTDHVPRPSRATLMRVLGGLSRSPGSGGTWTVDLTALRTYAAAVGVDLPDGR